jgi:uncharacterized protein
MTVDFGQLSRELDLAVEQIQRTVELLDDGNTVPFITRYRKDQTGGLNEEQIRRVHESVNRIRMLAERKSTILKSIESQGKLTPQLAAEINAATSTKRLEDLYLPYKPKKQTLATIARERGLEPLAEEVLSGDPAAIDLPARATFFVNEDKKLFVLADVLQGVGHLLAERFSERADLRGRLRKILWKTGKLVSTGGPKAEAMEAKPDKAATAEAAPAATTEASSTEAAAETATANADEATKTPVDAAQVEQPAPAALSETVVETSEVGAESVPTTNAEAPTAAVVETEAAVETKAVDSADVAVAETSPSSEEAAAAVPSDVSDVPAVEENATSSDASAEANTTEENAVVGVSTEVDTPATSTSSTPEAAAHAPPAADKPAAMQSAVREKRKEAKNEKKKKKKEKKDKEEAAFQDYFNFQEPITNLPPHRVLALNRGERAKVLKVRIEADWDEIERTADELLVPPEHPHAELLRACVRDALGRLVLPGLEREIRRELTERAEQHAVDVFARNLRNLLLQPPVRGRRVLAIDPGFRSGCKLTALDEFGNVLEHGVLHIVGKEERRAAGRQMLVGLIGKHNLSVVAIGNGTACRETEKVVAAVITEDLQGRDVAYLFVNEAGASVYSTSELGREELPTCDAIQRSAVSIGRRLLDPLSELVKINPANIGVGMYQHDVKAAHLRNSLDAVVESCVNYVGVDVNTASPALLRYVSGLNQLTARRLYEYRREHGPFRNREQFKEVPGFGNATFVQAAGFLKINGGDNPLDATWIHPESYDVAQKVLQRFDCSLEALRAPAARPVAAPAVSQSADSATAAPSDPPVAVEVESAAPPTTVGDVESQAAKAAEPQATAVAEAPATTASPAASPVASETPTAVDTAANGKPEPTAAANGGATRSPVLAKLSERAGQVDRKQLAEELRVGRLLLSDILISLARPGRDPRDDLPQPLFRRGVAKLEDLKPGMELAATVLNVVDFGAFVDIGLSDSGLVHISRLADRFVRDPHEVVAVGDVLRVWVVEVDKDRRRVSLTAIEPGREKPRQERGPRDRGQGRSQRKDGAGGGRPQGRRPDRKGKERGGKPGGKPPRTGKTPLPQPKRKARPAKPITKAMEEGREPMRSFSDLMQFFEKKKPDEEKK